MSKFKLFLEIYNQNRTKKIILKKEDNRFFKLSIEQLEERLFFVKNTLKFYKKEIKNIEEKRRIYKLLKLILIFKEGGNL